MNDVTTMRALIPLLALLLAPAAAAQTDGCVQADPCILDIEVDETGIASVSVVTLTAGDWFVLSVSNLDDRSHSVAFAGTSVQVEAYGYRDSAAFAAPAPGTYSLTDTPSGDSATLTVVAGDSVAAESSSDSAGAPGLALPLLVVGLVAVALMRRR